MADTAAVKDKILERLSAFDIYGDMKKVGNRLTRRCPLHEEKTASFKVNPDTLDFHCFGCGKGGDVIQFVMEKDGISFPEALKRLADKVGVEISDHGSSPNKVLYEANSAARDFYRDNLGRNKKAMEYLTEERRLTPESIEAFGLGCTGAGSVVDHLRQKGFSDDEIVRAGLGTVRDGRLRDMFWKRIMFPISKKGRIIGFGGRVIGSGEPKYLNSPATPIFYKKETLYCFDPAAVRASGYALVVEGYLDAIMCHQHGMKNTVAPLGTSLTAEHVEAIGKCTNWVLLVLDGDRAGKEAAEKTASMLFEKKMRGAVVVLPEEADPDSYLRKGGDFPLLIQKSVPFAVFLSDRSPDKRQVVYEKLLNERPALEVAEFLAYRGTRKDARIFGELQARALVEAIVKKKKTIYAEKEIEVKSFADFLLLFHKGNFLLYAPVNGKKFKEQAEQMAKSVLGRKEKAKNAGKAMEEQKNGTVPAEKV
jgi:DNA primase